MQGANFNLFSILRSSADIGLVNVSRYVEGNLNSSNLNQAIQTALDHSSILYVPKGEYSVALQINKDCEIWFDNEAILTCAPDVVTTKSPVLRASNCSIKIFGGTWYSGVNDSERKYVFMDPSWSPATYAEQRHGMIELNECYDSSIENLICTHSKFPTVIRIYNTENVIIQNCSFNNVLNSAIQIVDTCNNTVVRNCTIKHSRYAYNNYFCYAVYTGIKDMSTSKGTVPPDNLIYENNYVDDTEDCGLDTHGATNVTIRNNKVLNTVCAITAYNDRHRVQRPEGWRMRNVVIENNYCETTKDVDPNSNFPHAYVFVGSSGTSTTDSGDDRSGKASYDDFINCRIANNYLKTPNTNRVITLASVATNVTIDNNYIYQDSDFSKSVIYGVHTLGLRITNNEFHHKTLTTCPYTINHGDVYLSGNRGLYSTRTSSQLCRMYGEGIHARMSDRKGTVVQNAEVLNNNSGTKVFTVTSFIGSRVDPDAYTNTDRLSLVVDVVDNICYMQNGEHNYLLPDLGLEMKNNSTGTTYNAYVINLIAFDSFSINVTGGIPDGEYTVNLRTVRYETITSTYVPGKTNRQVALRETPESTGTSILTLPSDTNIIVNQTKFGNYNFVTAIVGGDTYHGYCFSNYIDRILDVTSS